MKHTTVYWSETELMSEVGNNAFSDRETYLLNVDLILFDTRLRNEPLASRFDMIGRLGRSSPDQCRRLIHNLERILIDTRLQPQHSPLVVRLLRQLRQAHSEGVSAVKAFDQSGP